MAKPHYECLGNYEIFTDQDDFYKIRLADAARRRLAKQLGFNELSKFGDWLLFGSKPSAWWMPDLSGEDGIFTLMGARRVAKRLNKKLLAEIERRNHSVDHKRWLQEQRDLHKCGQDTGERA